MQTFLTINQKTASHSLRLVFTSTGVETECLKKFLYGEQTSYDTPEITLWKMFRFCQLLYLQLIRTSVLTSKPRADILIELQKPSQNSKKLC